MEIVLLFKRNPMVQSAFLYSNLFRNDSLQKMAIHHHENSRKRQIYHHFVYLLHFLLDFSKLYMKLILLFTPNQMVETASLHFQPSRNNSLQKMA